MSTRSTALENVMEILENGKPLHVVLSRSLALFTDANERAFVSRLTRGTVERKLTLDRIIDAKSKVKTDKQKPVIRNILRCGVYQILYMDAVTDFAACNEAVRLAGRRGLKQLGGFVNGVLRAVCRDKEIRNEIEDSLSVKYSMPQWIVDEWTERFGVTETEEAFRYFFEENGIPVRCNISKISPRELRAGLKERGIEITDDGITEKCMKISVHSSLDSIDWFRQGFFVVQDASSVMAGMIRQQIIDDLKKDGNVPEALDLCAAPGGKSLNLADMGIAVTACDLTESKTKLIREAVNRCGFNNITVTENDASVFNADFAGRFDLVVCDLPCSGLGIIGKKPDIKYNMTPEKQAELTGLQKSILDNAVKYIKPGGYLIYSTCTVNRAENEEMAEYIAAHSGMQSYPLHDLPDKIREEYDKNCYVQLLPGEFGTDGFFISGFRKMPAMSGND